MSAATSSLSTAAPQMPEGLAILERITSLTAPYAHADGTVLQAVHRTVTELREVLPC